MPYGIVTNTKPGFIKASIPEMEDFETDWMPVITPLSRSDKAQFNLSINTQVYIIFEYDRYGEVISQVCLGGTYNDSDTVPFSDSKSGIVYEDGTEICYDVSSKTITISSVANLNLNGISVVLGTQGQQALVSLTTLNAFLTLVNTAISKIPAPPTGPEISALNAALQLVAQGVPSIKTPLL